MTLAKLHLRNHLLAATMRDRWETFDEIIDALRGMYGLKVTRLEVIEWLHEIAAEGYTISERPRGAEKELRLYAQTHAVELPVGKARK